MNVFFQVVRCSSFKVQDHPKSFNLIIRFYTNWWSSCGFSDVSIKAKMRQRQNQYILKFSHFFSSWRFGLTCAVKHWGRQ